MCGIINKYLMIKNLFNKLTIIFSCFLFLSAFVANAQSFDYIKLTSLTKDAFWDSNINITGESLPYAMIAVSMNSEDDIFSYSVKTNADNQGFWSVKLNQPLKTGKYYVSAVAEGWNKTLSQPVKSEIIDIRGPFALIVNIFSILVIFLVGLFLIIWYTSKSAEVKRYRRILSSQRDLVSSYNLLKNDIDVAIKDLSGNKIGVGRINDAKFFLERASKNIEKINKYVLQGIKVIGKYDIVSKLDNILKIKK
jgi:hypothetical protein